MGNTRTPLSIFRGKNAQIRGVTLNYGAIRPNMVDALVYTTFDGGSGKLGYTVSNQGQIESLLMDADPDVETIYVNPAALRNFTMFANLKYDMTERTIVNLFADRTSQESSYATNSYYEMNKVALNVDHLLAERLRLDGGGFIGYNRYPVTTIEGDDIGKRKDFLWGANAGLKYDIKEWLFVDVGYKFKQRTSRFSVYDYNDHKISAQLCAKF